MGMYRKEWDCCGSITETDAWEPEDCPFCKKPSEQERGKPVVVSVDELANHIRVVDGNHSLGAGALAEKIVEFLIKRAHGIKE